MMVCEICGGQMYSKIEDGCSITECLSCDNVHLNDIGLPPKSKYYNLELASQAVFDTIEIATEVTLRVLQKRFSHEQLSQIMVEWHETLHDIICEGEAR